MAFRRPALDLTFTRSWDAGSSLLLAALAASLLIGAPPALAQTTRKDPAPPTPEAKTPPCAECRRDDPPRPPASDTVTITPDMKTIVPQPVMREQADFNLGSALRRVPGVGVNGR